MYMGDSGGAVEQVSYAEADDILGPYTKFPGYPGDPGGPAIAFGPPGSFDAGTIADAWVVEFNGVYYIGYTVSPTTSSPWQTAMATTTDWQTFTKIGVIFPLGPPGAWDAPNSFRGAVTRFGDTYYFAYTGDSYMMGIATQDVWQSVPLPVGPEAVFPFFDGFDDDSFDTSQVVVRRWHGEPSGRVGWLADVDRHRHLRQDLRPDLGGHGLPGRGPCAASPGRDLWHDLRGRPGWGYF